MHTHFYPFAKYHGLMPEKLPIFLIPRIRRHEKTVAACHFGSVYGKCAASLPERSAKSHQNTRSLPTNAKRAEEQNRWIKCAERDSADGMPCCIWSGMCYLIARFMGPTWGPSGADRTPVGPLLAPWTLLSGVDNRGDCVFSVKTPLRMLGQRTRTMTQNRKQNAMMKLAKIGKRPTAEGGVNAQPLPQVQPKY